MEPIPTIDEADWIWLEGFDDTCDPGKFVLFRKTFELGSVLGEEQVLRVSADTRYRLFVNGHRAAFGPCKSYLARWYFDTVDVRPWLQVGHNVLAVQVLRFSPQHIGSSSMIRASQPGLILQGEISGFPINTDVTWKVVEDTSVSLIPRSEWDFSLGPPFVSLNERRDGRKAFQRWTETAFDDSQWDNAKVVTAKSQMMPVLEPRRLYERPIPALTEIERRFLKAVRIEGPVEAGEATEWLRSNKPLIIEPNAEVAIEIQAETLTCGFMELVLNAGPGASIKITYAECYEGPPGGPDGGPPMGRKKGDRANHAGKILKGVSDEYISHKGRNVIEPFWFGTFRFIRLCVSATWQPVVLERIRYRETHYPLQIGSDLTKPGSLMGDLWKISIKTLRNCMHETYEDCPFYEQNQFAMDTRLLALYTYQLSPDDRLARKALQEFYASRRDDGLIEAQFPSPCRSINVPQFSLYWVLMVYDHACYFNDMALVRRYLGAIDDVLNYFVSRIDNETDMIGRLDGEAWAFVDWVEEWFCGRDIYHMCIPPCYHVDGIVAYNSLLAAIALQKAATLNERLGRRCVASEYRARAAMLNEAVNKHCWDGEMYLDGPSAKISADLAGDATKTQIITGQYCQHTQIFAILSGAIEGSSAQTLFRKTMVSVQSGSLPKCSYSMSFYTFRAASLTDLYTEYFDVLIEPWKGMIKDNLTTWAEDDVMKRSDCHGWSSVPIYEIVSEIFGFSPVHSGELTIKPRVALMEKHRIKEGRFVVPGDSEKNLKVSWNLSDRSFDLQSSGNLDVVVEIEGKRATVSIKAPVTSSVTMDELQTIR